MRQTRLATLAVGLVALSAGCGFIGPDSAGPVTEPPPDASAPPTSPGGAPPPGEVVGVDREWHEAKVHFDVSPVEVDGDLAVLRYDFTATPADPSQDPWFSTLALSLGELGHPGTEGRGVRLFDTDAGLVHAVAHTSDGAPAALIDQVESESGDEPLHGAAIAVFAAPESDSVDVLLPGYGAVTVPVVAAGDDFQDAVDQVGGVGEAETTKLRAFTRSYEAGSATSAEDDDVTVTLASDVLFASDEHTLSKKARGVVDRAAASIKRQADAGDVQVVGHTDDVDTDSYNQMLSERRAKAVADRLRAGLGNDFTVTEEGRGESEPIVQDTTEEARAANRRVEIQFRGHLVVEADPESDVPETDAPTAENDAVTITTDDSRYTVEVESMVRRPGAIVGTLVAERTKGTSTDPAWFLPAYLDQIGGREFGALADVAGAHNLSLLGAEERVLPFDYVAEKSDGFVLRRLLGDEEVKPLDRGMSTLITVVWPDTGQDTVTVDAPDRFRITDVPVTDAPTGD
ncbi:OmpA family protein [Promicromonospora sp. AC04]|uniref:OmpA family protein n=1 Tax=Promicromonospora sp. AC04 TaxID=2135723 RepID=UPI000D38329B|nr:OmpA family protein [Promicromonospora sp. AC04]PUB30153.1 OmpA family protein [Promicromonospora sp. AC04]